MRPPAPDAFLVAAPRRCDALGSALRLAFSEPYDPYDDFASLLRRIDVADGMAR